MPQQPSAIASEAIRRLQRDGPLSDDVMHRTSKYLNNIIEADHGALKQVIRPARGFQTMKTAYAAIKERYGKLPRTVTEISPEPSHCD
ncbi:MAG: DDE-type integrase/transposase/recombinase [Janthinobacterium lividum]